MDRCITGYTPSTQKTASDVSGDGWGTTIYSLQDLCSYTTLMWIHTAAGALPLHNIPNIPKDTCTDVRAITNFAVYSLPYIHSFDRRKQSARPSIPSSTPCVNVVVVGIPRARLTVQLAVKSAISVARTAIPGQFAVQLARRKASRRHRRRQRTGVPDSARILDRAVRLTTSTRLIRLPTAFRA